MTLPHHPHFISAEPNRFGITYTFKPFDGTEAEPRYQHVDGLTEDERKVYSDEIEAAHDRWALAKFLCDAAAVITGIGADWQKYLLAQAGLAGEYNRLRETPADRWPSQIMAILEAQDRALAAAAAWDRAANTLAALHRDYQAQARPGYGADLAVAAARTGIDISDWHIGQWADGTAIYQNRLADKVRGDIETQKERIQEISDLAALGFDYSHLLTTSAVR